MSSKHPHRPRHGRAHHASHAPHHEQAHHHEHARHPRRRRKQRHLSPRRPTGLFAIVGQALFRTRHGNVSRPKILSLGIVSIGILYILLVRGFFPFDLASPWVATALERQLGPGHRVEIGSTRMDHDASGAPVLRVERIRVFGPGGKVIAHAPRAEVGLDGSSLLVGNFRARRIDLVGAETTVYVGTDGRVAIRAGRDAAPITAADAGGATEAEATAAIPVRPLTGRTAAVTPRERAEPFHYPELARWLDSFEKGGLDGVALSQIGLKQGSLVVQDVEGGRNWSFDNINIQLSRPAEGGLLFSLSSNRAGEDWSLTATVAPAQGEARAIDVVARNLDPSDIMLAAGLTGADFLAENPLSGVLRAQIARDGRLLAGNFRASAGSGTIGRANDPEARIRVDEVQVQARFDPERKATIIEPVLLQAGPNRFAVTAIVEAPTEGSSVWPISIPQGVVFLSTGKDGEAPLILDQVTARGTFDSDTRRLVIERGILGGATIGGAFSGSVNLEGTPSLALGLAASQVPVSAAKRLWPSFVARGSRGWALERVESGVIERFLLAMNVPLEAIGKPNYDMPDEAIRLEFSAAGGAFRPAADLPLIRDVEVSGVITGRTAHLRVPKGTMTTPQGRQIALMDGVLEVPNHIPPNPDGTIRFRFEGPADAVAEMASSDLLQGITGFQADPATAKGTASADVNMELVFRQEIRGDEVKYTAEGQLKDFAAEGVVRGQAVEGVSASVSVAHDAIRAKGNGRIAGAPATFELRRATNSDENQFRVSATLDSAARAKLGLDLSPALTGSVQAQISGRANPREYSMDVEADLTAATITDLMPGWQKPSGRAAKASFRVVERENGVRLENISVSGGGTTLRGSLDLDSNKSFVAANFPVFHLSDGDKATLRAERTNDGALRVVVRGDVLDVRGAIRELSESGNANSGHAEKPRDIDLELRLGAATGHNGEVARQVDLRMSRRNGEVRSFSLIGRIGRDASMVGELRRREGGGSVIYLTAGDAGALLRYADFYGRVYGGEAWIVIEPPRVDGKPQEGIINIRDFTIRGEPALARMQAAAPAEQLGGSNNQPQAQGVQFLRSQIEFNRTPGRFNIREGVIYGPTIGATVDGVLDFAKNHVHLRGTYIPAYGLNNLFGQLPIVGLFLGGPREGLIAITFEVVGPATGPTLRVNPMSAAAPGLLRKLFEFRGSPDTPPASGPLDP